MEDKKEFLKPEERELAGKAFDQDWPDDENLTKINSEKSEWDEIKFEDEFKEMHEALEANEDLVECQECFDLFPKAECIKVDYGYLCPHCHKIHMIEIEPELVDEAPLDLDFDDPEEWYDKGEDVPVETEISGDSDFGSESAVTVAVGENPEDVTVVSPVKGEEDTTIETPVSFTDIPAEFSSDDSSDSGADALSDKDVEVMLAKAETLEEPEKLEEDVWDTVDKVGKGISSGIRKLKDKFGGVAKYLDDKYKKGYYVIDAEGKKLPAENKKFNTFEDAEKYAKNISKTNSKEDIFIKPVEGGNFLRKYYNGTITIDNASKMVKNEKAATKLAQKTDAAAHAAVDEKEPEVETKEPTKEEPSKSAEEKPTEVQAKKEEPKETEQPTNPKAEKAQKIDELSNKVKELIKDGKISEKQLDQVVNVYKRGLQMTRGNHELATESLTEETANVKWYELHFLNQEDEKIFGGLDKFENLEDAYGKSLEYLDDGHPCEIKKLICNGDICSLVDLDEPNAVNETLDEAAPKTPFDSDAKVGDRIRINHLEGEGPDYDGKEGEVQTIDSIGQLHGTWGGLAVIPGVDDFEIISEGLKEATKVTWGIESYDHNGNAEYEEFETESEALKAYEETVNWLKKEPTSGFVSVALYKQIGGEDEPVDYIKHFSLDESLKEANYSATATHTEEVGLGTFEAEDQKDAEDKAEMLYKDGTFDSYSDETNIEVEKVSESLTEEKEDEEEIPTDFAGIMDYLSKDEEEAIEGYDKVLDNVEDEKVKDNLEHIRDEEVAHKEYLDAAKEDPTVDYEHAEEDDSVEIVVDENFAESLKENLTEASSAETRAYKNGGKDADDLIQGKAIARIKDPEAQKAAVAAVKAGRPEVAKQFYGDRKEDQAAAAYEKKAKAMSDAGVADESLEFTVPQDLHDDRAPKQEEEPELAKPVDGSEVRKHEKAIQEDITPDNTSYRNAENYLAYLDAAIAFHSDALENAKRNNAGTEVINAITKTIEKYQQDKEDFLKPVKTVQEGLDIKEEPEIFTPEEQKEYDCDEDGYCLNSHDQLHHCGWCGEIDAESAMKHEVDFGWICDRCEAELKSHGGPLVFIENESK